jgi:hypothetical protein
VASRWGPAPRRPLPLLLCVLLLAACDGGKKETGVERGGSKSGVAAVCRGKNTALPKTFGRFPFPHGAVLTTSRVDAGATVVEGFVRNRSLDDVRDELRSNLAKNGYRLGEGEAEEHEAETGFTGNNVRGYLKLRDDVCANAVSFGIALR